MPNTIKYSTTGDTQSLKKGNLYLGVGDVPKGPSNVTLHYQGISPPNSGYTIYANTTGALTTIFCANNDFQIINFTKGFSGQNFTGVTESLTWYSTQNNFACVNRDYETTITSDLSVCLDAGYVPSYPRSGTTYYNIGNNDNPLTFSLVNGVTYSTDGGGSLLFDGVDDEVVSNDRYTMVSGMTWDIWVKRTSDGNVFNMMMSNFLPYMAFRGTGSGSDINKCHVTYRTVTGGTTTQRNLYTTGATFSNNVWYNFTYTLLYDLQNQLATAKIYVNGVFNTSSSNYSDSINQPSVGSRLRLGNYTSNQYPFPGYIGRFLVYNKVLTDAEISQNYNAFVDRFTPSINANLVFNLDGANYSAMPVNGSTIDGTGAYPITMTNTNNSMSWNSSNGGVFRKSTANTSDLFIGGPNYSSGSQAYTVFMAYKWDGGTAGRLLNANSASPDWLLGLWGDPASRMNIAFNGAFVGSNSTAADTAWHFIWMTDDGLNTTNSTKSYIATNVAPSGTNGTRNASSGFNSLRLYGRYSTATTSSEPVTGDVGFVKVWDGALTLSEIQELHAYYKARFGY